jgi:plasmid replication initiation protein
MRGYMAPPLKPMLDFFVLTEVRLAYCPFCSSAAEWPDDIAVVYTPSPMRATERAIMVEGTIETGSKVDAQTGMLSLVRIYADRIGKL